MNILPTIKRLLTFKLTRAEMLQFNKKHFIAGLIGTWIVGMGRYWDDGGASLLQHVGLGSVIYIFVLAAFIWLIVKPFRVDNWNYFTVVTFIALTSFPAIFYAIPVERFFFYSNSKQYECLVSFNRCCVAIGVALLFPKTFYPNEWWEYFYCNLNAYMFNHLYLNCFKSS